MSALSGYDNTFLDCRDLRHSWERGRAYVLARYRGAPREVARVLICSRCDAERHDVYAAPSYSKLRSRYVYPEGYRIPDTETDHRINGEDVRREVFDRLSVELVDADAA